MPIRFGGKANQIMVAKIRAERAKGRTALDLSLDYPLSESYIARITKDVAPKRRYGRSQDHKAREEIARLFALGLSRAVIVRRLSVSFHLVRQVVGAKYRRNRCADPERIAA